MNESQNPLGRPDVTRRSFLQTSGVAVGGALLGGLSIERAAHAAGSDQLKIALVGCGGRGSGAANQALSTSGDIKLVAVADVHEDKMTGSLSNLRRSHPTKVDVKPENEFMGFDGYKKAIAVADVVILATPPGFRPMMFEEAVKQGKHVFMEKPVCVDAPGFRKVMAAAQEAKKKNLKVGVGLQRRHQPPYLETMKRLQDGAIGDIVSMRCFWNGNTPWVRRREELEKQANRKLTEMEYQLRNWYYFVWLCGDHICEQHIHNIDVINWLKNGPPVKARGMGGCETRKGLDYGEIFDHHSVEFTYADGSICHSMCRHQLGCWNEVSEYAIGSKGRSDIHRYTITGANQWRYREEKKVDPYQQEHDDLFDAIRNNKPYNEAEYGATSSMTSVLGRMATYSGKEVEWDAAIKSNIDTMVKGIDVGSFADALKLTPPTLPGKDGLYQLPVPGKTVVI
jgi:myo-inositol 2-dehydrogenase/D-chiro-inositol 1-dehydrogenase